MPEITILENKTGNIIRQYKHSCRELTCSEIESIILDENMYLNYMEIKEKNLGYTIKKSKLINNDIIIIDNNTIITSIKKYNKVLLYTPYMSLALLLCRYKLDFSEESIIHLLKYGFIFSAFGLYLVINNRLANNYVCNGGKVTNGIITHILVFSGHYMRYFYLFYKKYEEYIDSGRSFSYFPFTTIKDFIDYVEKIYNNGDMLL